MVLISIQLAQFKPNCSTKALEERNLFQRFCFGKINFENSARHLRKV